MAGSNFVFNIRSSADFTQPHQTIAAIGFPIIITLLVPLRVFVVPRLGFTKAELDILDGPTAGPFVSQLLIRHLWHDFIADTDADDGIGRGIYMRVTRVTMLGV